jgi:hypothetical protein
MKYQKCKNGTRKNKNEDCVDKTGNIVVRREDRIEMPDSLPKPESKEFAMGLEENVC